MVDLLMRHNTAVQYVRVLGIEAFVNQLEEKFPYKFYSCSDCWIEDPSYICKLKGKNGDLIVGWYGVHD